MIEQQLRDETEKWLARAKEERKKIKVNDENSSFLKNVDAYIKDSEYFLEKNDLIHAFEAVIWSWSWMEICTELGVFKRTD